MTEQEWQTCETPSRLLKVGSYWPESRRRWVYFDLACIARVSDLITDEGCLSCINAVANWIESNQQLPRWRLEQHAGSGAVCRLWLERKDPLQKAKIAAARAVSRLASQTCYVSDMVCVAVGRRVGQPGLPEAVRAERRHHANLVRCVFRSTLTSPVFHPAWRTTDAVAIARMMYDSGDFSAMPILADALQDAGCDNEHILNHCRDTQQPHVRGCWVVDLVLGKR